MNFEVKVEKLPRVRTHSGMQVARCRHRRLTADDLNTISPVIDLSSARHVSAVELPSGVNFLPFKRHCSSK